MAARSKKLRWSRLADLDLQSAHDFLAELNPQAAQRLAADILRALELLQRHPEGGAIAADLRDRGPYRHWPVGRHRIIYRVDGELIWILRIWDTRRNPELLIPE